MSSLVGGTRIIGQDMVCGFSNGKYKTFEGAEISIECVKAKVKDLRVEGKTYQNLCIEDTSNEMSILNFSNYNMFKINTYYTVIFEITVDNASQVNLAYNTSSHVLVAPKGNNKGIYKFKVRNINTSLGDITSVRLLSLTQEGYTTCLFKNVIVLEGDYTNTDLPDSIDGIESVTEKEENVLSVKINDNTTTLNLPIPLRSLPNNVCDTIEGNKLVQRVGRVVLENIKDYNIADQIKNNNRIGIMVGNVLGSSTRKPIISDHFFDLSNGGESVNGSFSYGGRIFLYLGLSTLEEYVEWFKGNPTTFYYSLSEPIIHDLEIPSVSTTKGTNIITTENNIKPKLSMKVKVK